MKTDEQLLELFNQDCSSPYDMEIEEIRRLLNLIGEHESTIDALLKAEGASIKTRAEAIGVDEIYFRRGWRQ